LFQRSQNWVVSRVGKVISLSPNGVLTCPQPISGPFISPILAPPPHVTFVCSHNIYPACAILFFVPVFFSPTTHQPPTSFQQTFSAFKQYCTTPFSQPPGLAPGSPPPNSVHRGHPGFVSPVETAHVWTHGFVFICRIPFYFLSPHKTFTSHIPQYPCTSSRFASFFPSPTRQK